MPHREARAEVGMLAVELLVGVVVLAVLAFVLSRDTEGFDDEPADSPDPGLPDGRLLRSDDISRLRFRVGLRGYRMADVDAAMDAAQRALAAAEGSPAQVAEPVRVEQPPTTVDRPLSELEQTSGVADESR